MNQKEAFRETLVHCEDRWPVPMWGETSIEHMRDMLRRIDANSDATAPGGFSEAKLGRWLGYLQGVAVGLDVMTLEECKDINKKWAADDAPFTSVFAWSKINAVRGTSVVNPSVMLLDDAGKCIGLVHVLNCQSDAIRYDVERALATAGDPAKMRRFMAAARHGEAEANERAEKAEATLAGAAEAIAFRIEQMSGLFDQATINEAVNVIRTEFGAGAKTEASANV